MRYSSPKPSCHKHNTFGDERQGKFSRPYVADNALDKLSRYCLTRLLGSAS